MPPRSPCGGRVRRRTRVIGAQHHEGGAAAQVAAAFFCFFGKASCEPAARARQGAIHGQRAQAGRFGVQIVAPRSIRAWAKSPGRAGGTSSGVSARRSGFALGNGSSMVKSRDTTRSTLPSTAAAGWLKAIAATAAAV